MVSRNGCVTYVSIIKAADSEIIQVNDHFHLIEGLGGPVKTDSAACKCQLPDAVSRLPL